MTTEAGAGLLRLLAWLSPAFPTGGFAWSHGIEWAVEAGDVTDGASLGDWLADVLRHGSGRNDAILLRHAHRAAGDAAALAALAEFARAAAGARERRAESIGQGNAFAAAAAAWGAEALRRDRRPPLPGRGRRPCRRPRHRRGRGCRRVPAGRRRQPDLGRGPPDPARPVRRAGACSPGSKRLFSTWRRRRATPRWTISAAPASAPTSPPCGTKRSTRGCSGHDEHEWTPARRRRRPGGQRQDRADGRAVQAPARALRPRRHHQRHLHQGRRGIPHPRRLTAAGTHPRHRDRRLPAHRDPRGRQHQPRGRRGAARAVSRHSTSC